MLNFHMEHHWHYITIPLGIVANVVSVLSYFFIVRLQKRIARLENERQ